MDYVQTTMCSEISSETQKSTDCKDASRGKGQSALALDVKTETLHSFNILRIFLANLLVSTRLLIINNSSHNENREVWLFPQ